MLAFENVEKALPAFTLTVPIERHCWLPYPTPRPASNPGIPVYFLLELTRMLPVLICTETIVEEEEVACPQNLSTMRCFLRKETDVDC